jgi:hypothetical protein
VRGFREASWSVAAAWLLVSAGLVAATASFPLRAQQRPAASQTDQSEPTPLAPSPIEHVPAVVVTTRPRA